LVMQNTELDFTEIDKIITNALREDIGTGDITTNALINENDSCKAMILAKDDAVIAGLPIANRVFSIFDDKICFTIKVNDGEIVQRNQTVAEIIGNARTILTCERLALNFLQRLSGIATYTHRFLKEVQKYNVKILDTRKTVPGLRLLDKYAVKMGGGTNHRFGLFDGVLIKENHIKCVGDVVTAIEKAKKENMDNFKVEVEVSTLNEVGDALRSGADIIMLDNMSVEEMSEAVNIVGGKAKLEASGCVNLDSVESIAKTGVDYISIGSLTHSPPSVDISLYLV